MSQMEEWDHDIRVAKPCGRREGLAGDDMGGARPAVGRNDPRVLADTARGAARACSERDHDLGLQAGWLAPGAVGHYLFVRRREDFVGDNVSALADRDRDALRNAQDDNGCLIQAIAEEQRTIARHLEAVAGIDVAVDALILSLDPDIVALVRNQTAKQDRNLIIAADQRTAALGFADSVERVARACE